MDDVTGGDLVEDGVAFDVKADVVGACYCRDGGLLEEVATADIGAAFLEEWPCEGGTCGEFNIVLDCCFAIRRAL